ncbi:MAG: type II methionyl aminopeptidase [Candidatus Lokiarchaeota archaeon]|nr:type II methionyl aminopeptidase [Candidatus Lokiarchaeota archaeon]
MPEMDDDIFEKYLKAGRAVAKALDLAEKITRPGAKYLDIAKLVEGEIINSGCELSFPINMSLDEQAAHYSPIIEDPLVVPEHGLIKIDCGSHYKGYIADAAVTIDLGNDGGLYEDLINGASEALSNALNIVKPGINVAKLGEEIHRTMQKYNVKPVSNLGGHGLDAYSLHTGLFIPNTGGGMHNDKLELGKAYACEPFSTNGVGRIKNGKEITIFEVQNTKKKNMKLTERSIAQKFRDKFGSLPFSPRAIDFIKGKQRINDVVDKFLRKRVLRGYNVFVEVGGGIVAQKEHTFIVTKDGAHITTILDND